MKDKVKVTGLYASLSMLRKHTHHANYHTDEDAFIFTKAPVSYGSDIEQHEFAAIIEMMTYMAQHIYSTPEGRLDPSKILFKYKVEDGDVMWRIKIGGQLYATVKFNTIPGLADGEYGSHLPFCDSAPSPIRYNSASDIFRTDIILKDDARAMRSFIIGSLYDSPDYNEIASVLARCPGADLSFALTSQPMITMKFRGDIGGSDSYTVKLVSTPATPILINNWRKEEFYEAVKEARVWCHEHAPSLYMLSLKP